MSVINATPLLAAAGGDYQISRSVRLRSSASAYFNRTPASAGNRKTWTWSGWVKRGTINSSAAVAYPLFAINSANNDSSWFDVRFISDQLYIGAYTLNYRITTQVFRDPSAWYHVVIALDTTQATANNRLRVYVNGVEITAFSTTNNPTQNADLAINLAAVTYIGATGGERFDGYLTEINFIDGQALTPSSFGETDAITGVWKPKKYAGTYGTNGFYLNFSDNSSNTATTIGKDNSGNGNNWTPNNISVTAGATYDSMIDVPTLYADGGNGRGNYCTLNPLSWRFAVAQGTFSEGNLRFTYSGGSSAFAFGTIGVSSGKWYCETTITAVGSSGASVGISDLQAQWGTFTNRFVYNSDGTHTGAGANWATYTTNDVIGIAYDLDANSLSFYKNNALQGSVTLNSGVTYHLELDAVLNSIYSANFGQRPFAYTPPTGFKALNTQNLPAPTILKGNKYFDVSLFTGSTSGGTVTNTGGFQPDFVWTKTRDISQNHTLIDSVRGGSGQLISNLTNAENINANLITSFNSNGFTYGVSLCSNNSYVGWQWKANGSAVTNTSGSISSQVNAGTSQGFSVVTYTGTGANATVGHGLGVAPKMVIVKMRSISGGAWGVYHASVGATGALFLDQTAAVNTALTFWNNTAPTSSVFTIGTNGNINQVANFVAYCFSEVAGFSKFGSYTGNGSADGPMIFTGFRPAFIILKRTDSTGNWTMYDSERSTFNASTRVLYPNLSNAEDASTDHFDWLSNGFKMKSTNQNTSGGTFIYMAFAEYPFKNTLAV